MFDLDRDSANEAQRNFATDLNTRFLHNLSMPIADSPAQLHANIDLLKHIFHEIDTKRATLEAFSRSYSLRIFKYGQQAIVLLARRLETQLQGKIRDSLSQYEVRDNPKPTNEDDSKARRRWIIVSNLNRAVDAQDRRIVTAAASALEILTIGNTITKMHGVEYALPAIDDNDQEWQEEKISWRQQASMRWECICRTDFRGMVDLFKKVIECRCGECF